MTDSAQSRDRARALFHTANVWQLKGRVDAAAENYEEAIRLDPRLVPAYLKLGLLMLKVGRTDEALSCYTKAVDIAPDDEDARFHYNFVKNYLQCKNVFPDGGGEIYPKEPLPDNPRGRIRLTGQVSFQHHRSGWKGAIQALRPLHSAQGVFLDSFIEANFGWKHWKNWVNPPDVLEKMKREGTYDLLATSEEKGIIPYTEPWIGMVHNPPLTPAWFDSQISPQVIFEKTVWKRSLAACRGLFTLSEYLANWIRRRLDLTVSSLLHPTEFPEVLFEFDRFMANPEKKIVQIGLWLRRLTAIHRLPLGRDNPLGYRKIRLLHMIGIDRWHQQLIRHEQHDFPSEIESRYQENTRVMNPVSNTEYDDLLAENIVFLSLYDSSANNTVVECMARTTPLLVNPLPAVTEYLGPDYPLYYQTLEEAARKALDTGLLREAHEYLKNCDNRHRIRWDYFLESFEKSEVYRQL